MCVTLLFSLRSVGSNSNNLPGTLKLQRVYVSWSRNNEGFEENKYDHEPSESVEPATDSSKKICTTDKFHYFVNEVEMQR